MGLYSSMYRRQMPLNVSSVQNKYTEREDGQERSDIEFDWIYIYLFHFGALCKERVALLYVRTKQSFKIEFRSFVLFLEKKMILTCRICFPEKYNIDLEQLFLFVQWQKLLYIYQTLFSILGEIDFEFPFVCHCCILR